MHRRSFPLLLVAVVLLGSLVAFRTAGRTGAQDDAADGDPHPIVGTWIVDQDVADTADPPALSIIMGEGAWYESNPAVGDGVGVWVATGARTAAATIVFQVVDADGAIQATVKARADIEVDASGDAFTSTYAFEGTAPDGTLLFSGQATGRAARLAVEPRVPDGTPAVGTPVAGVETEILFAVTLPAEAVPSDPAGAVLVRFTLAPGGAFDFSPSCYVAPAVIAAYVETGDFAIRPGSQARIARGGAASDGVWEPVAAGTEVVIGPGDAVVQTDLPAVPGEFGNAGDEALSILEFAIWGERVTDCPPAGVVEPWFAYLDGRDWNLPTGPVAVELRRVTLAPGADLPPYETAWSELIHVDAGRLEWTTQPSEAAPGQPLSFRAPSSVPWLALPTGTTRTLHNAGDEPLVLLVLSFVPAGG
jgi:hypothetical protein